jgi:hypothetical protein
VKLKPRYISLSLFIKLISAQPFFLPAGVGCGGDEDQLLIFSPALNYARAARPAFL